MHRGVRIRGFEFYEQAAFHENVGSKGVLDENTTMFDRNRELAFEAHTASFQFRAEQDFIRRFQTTGPTGPVELIPAIDDDPS